MVSIECKIYQSDLKTDWLFNFVKRGSIAELISRKRTLWWKRLSLFLYVRKWGHSKLSLQSHSLLPSILFQNTGSMFSFTNQAFAVFLAIHCFAAYFGSKSFNSFPIGCLLSSFCDISGLFAKQNDWVHIRN